MNKPLFDFIFVVYPGTTEQVRGYAPLWYRHITPHLAAIGMIRRGKQGKRGLVMTICWTMDELEEQKDFLRKIADKTKNIAETIGAKSVALAGRMPSVLHQNGYQLRPPIVAGDKGAIYTLLLSIKAALENNKLDLETVKIGIIGHGFLGSRLAKVLQELGAKNIISVDPRIIDEDIHLTRDPAALNDRDLAIALTAKGEQIDAIIGHLKEGVIVVDDTHPQLPAYIENEIKKQKHGQIIKATLELKGVRFFPRLPKWQTNWLPGCCVEALVSAALGFTSDQRRFNERADMLGFSALNVSNKSDL